MKLTRMNRTIVRAFDIAFDPTLVMEAYLDPPVWMDLLTHHESYYTQTMEQLLEPTTNLLIEELVNVVD